MQWNREKKFPVFKSEDNGRSVSIDEAKISWIIELRVGMLGKQREIDGTAREIILNFNHTQIVNITALRLIVNARSECFSLILPAFVDYANEILRHK